MGTLGDFGTPHEALTDTFGYFGAEIRVHPDLTDLAVIEMFGRMSDVAEAEGEEEQAKAALRAANNMQRIGETLVHPDDLDQFTELARANRQTIEDLAKLAAGLLEALSDRPTVLPSDSSGGRRRTGTRSTAGSSSRALEALEGRPDKQVAVLRRQRDREARSA